MAKVVGDIAVSVGADVSGLQAGMDRAGRSVKGFDKKSKRMAANFAKVGAAVTAAAAAVAVGLAKMASNAAKTAKDIQNLSNIAGTGVEKFQRYAQAAQSVGIEQDKLADIFKDVNDKFGDFLETGAGPLADFFENIAPQVGVTAKQFARLSGPEALQLYVSSLEAAGLSQQRMTFYMEALASDATALIPLLRDGGSEMERLGDKAETAGRILSEEAVKSGAELDDKLRELSDTIRTQFSQAILDNADDITALAETITEDWIPALVTVAGFIADVVSAIANMVAEIGSAMGALMDFSSMAAETLDINPSRGTTGSAVRRNTSGRSSNADQRPAINPDLFDPRNGVYGDFSSDYDANVQAEEEAREEALIRLEEYRKRQQEIEDAADGVRRSKKQKTEDELAEIERKARAKQLNDVSGAFGDIASITRTENKKLFKIGQAAAVAEATVSGYKAATEAWAKGMKAGGPPTAAAFTAASLARTGALISSITSTSIGGGGGGGVGGGAGTAAASADQGNRSFFNISLQGGDQFGADQVRTLIGRINEEIEDGAVLGGVRVV